METVVVSFSFIFMRTLNMNELQAGTTVVSEEVKETLDKAIRLDLSLYSMKIQSCMSLK